MANAPQLLIGFVVILFSLTVHESAHAWTADKLGDPTARMLGRVSLNPLVHMDLLGTIILPLAAAMSGAPLIGWAKPVPVNHANLREPRRDHLFIAAAGPVSNLGLAAICAAAFRAAYPATLVGSAPIAAPITQLLHHAILINVFLAVFNLIPIPPLDGSGILSGFLPDDLAHLYDRIRPYGFLLLYVLVLTPLLGWIVVPPARMIIGWLLG